MEYQITNIIWDNDDPEMSLPTSMTIFAHDEDDLSDLISDKIGYCHHGFDYTAKED